MKAPAMIDCDSGIDDSLIVITGVNHPGVTFAPASAYEAAWFRSLPAVIIMHDKNERNQPEKREDPS